MILSKYSFENLLASCNSILSLGRQVTVDDCKAHSVDYNLFTSLWHQLYVRRTRLMLRDISIGDISEVNGFKVV